MNNGIKGTSGLPYGYGIGKVQPVSKSQMDVRKEREKQNEEKRVNLMKQKSFIEELRRQQKIMQEQEENGKNFDRRI